MGEFKEYLKTIDEESHKDCMEKVLQWIIEHYPKLETKVAWNQPMFTHQGTYIIGFSHSKHHIAMAPETKPILEYKDIIEELGFSYTDNIIRIKWTDPFPYEFMQTLIEYNIEDKDGYAKFWR